jgi:hypothetical protein
MIIFEQMYFLIAFDWMRSRVSNYVLVSLCEIV